MKLDTTKLLTLKGAAAAQAPKIGATEPLDKIDVK